MENNSLFENENKSAFDTFELQFTQQAQGFVRETAKWATFLSIMGFIFIGFMVLGALGMFAMGSTMSSMGAGSPMGAMGMLGGATMGIMFLLFALLYFFPVLYLYKFASNAKEALNSNNTERLTVAFENLKSHYKFVGILTVIGLAFYVLIFIFSIVAGVAAAA
jgi:uncharacterized membrane protein